MSDDQRVSQLYFATCLVLILLLILYAQLAREPPKPKRKYPILVQTEKGLISAPKRRIVSELVNVRKHLVENKGGIRCPGVKKLIDSSMRKLAQFLRQNPKIEPL